MHPCNSVLPIFSGDGVPALVRFFVLAFDFVLLSELGPGLGHFDQQRLVGLVRGFAGQAQAFGRAFGGRGIWSRNPPAARQRGRLLFGSLHLRMWTSRTLSSDAIGQNRIECVSFSGTGWFGATTHAVRGVSLEYPSGLGVRDRHDRGRAAGNKQDSSCARDRAHTR